jgi:protein TonB
MAGAVTASLLVAIAAFRLWPLPADEPARIVFDTRGQEVISMEQILPTRQLERRPRPPAPAPPVVVPDDVELPEGEIELTDVLDYEPPVVGRPTGATTNPQAVFVQPDAGPRPVRIVEPEYTAEARSRRIRAEVIVEVLVDARGRVSEARVTERFVLKGKDGEERERVAAIGYGLETAAVSAAEQWMFRPARENGQVVESWTTLTFSFGL